MVVYVYCKLLFSMFHLFSQTMLQVCLFGYCKCFTHMLQVFLSGRCVCFPWFSGVFVSVSDVCLKCFICLHTYVASVVSGCFKNKSGVAYLLIFLLPCLGGSSSSQPAGHPPPPPLFLNADDVWDVIGPCGRVKRRRKTDYGLVWVLLFLKTLVLQNHSFKNRRHVIP